MSRSVSGASRALALAAVMTAAFVPAPARAGDCSGVSCATGARGSATEVVTDADQVTAAAADTVDGVIDAGNDAADQANNAVDEAVDEANGVLGRVDPADPTEDPGGGGSRGDGSGPRGAGANAGTTNRSHGGGRPASVASAAVPAGSTEAAVTGDLVEAAVVRRPSGFFDAGLGRVVLGAARRLAFPIVLLVLVLGFIVVQDRIDRRSKKLALARVDRDVVRFT